jgi:ribonuclease P protein component
MSDFSFPEKIRLKSKKLFDLIFEKGDKKVNRCFVIWHYSFPEFFYGNDSNFKIAIMVSRKLGKAVKRNRIKRLVRESVRLNKDKIKEGSLIILSPRFNENSNLEEICKEILDIFKKAEVLK